MPIREIAAALPSGLLDGSIALAVMSFLIAILFIVAAHEFGHYATARACGIISTSTGPPARSSRGGLTFSLASGARFLPIL